MKALALGSATILVKGAYIAEFRHNLGSGQGRHDLTMNLWVEMIQDICR